MIAFKGVSVDFGSRTLLDNVTLQIRPGEFVFLVGQTGSGKSTMLRLIYMDILPSRGAVFVGKHCSASIQPREIPSLRRELGVVFQDFKLLEDRSVFDNVAFTLHVTGTHGAEIKRKVIQTLGDVGLSHARNKMADELSGGEQQRVAIARALVNNPAFLLADEPTGNLDPGTSGEILALLKEINMRGTACVVATHNYDIVRKAKGRILRIEEGAVTEVDSPA
ncbi:MAG TPA: ATP-binding cassette domain-containing protein [Bacteroidota bacterium]|nr:ATP-binding cassette domain-containing protein [Bacteroidota bacterium]